MTEWGLSAQLRNSLVTIPRPLLRSSSSKAFNRLSNPFTVTEEQKPTLRSALLNSPTALTVTWDSRLMRTTKV